MTGIIGTMSMTVTTRTWFIMIWETISWCLDKTHQLYIWHLPCLLSAYKVIAFVFLFWLSSIFEQKLLVHCVPKIYIWSSYQNKCNFLNELQFLLYYIVCWGSRELVTMNNTKNVYQVGIVIRTLSGMIMSMILSANSPNLSQFSEFYWILSPFRDL